MDAEIGLLWKVTRPVPSLLDEFGIWMPLEILLSFWRNQVAFFFFQVCFQHIFTQKKMCFQHVGMTANGKADSSAKH